MKGVFDEISDDEWENHEFRASRVLKKRDLPLPAIETFAYRTPKSRRPGEESEVRSRENVVDLEDDDEVPVVRPTQGGRSRARRFVVDEDSDEGTLTEVVDVRSTEDEGGFADGELEEKEKFADGELEGDEKFADDELEDEEQFPDDELEGDVEEQLSKQEEVDLVRKALQKCARISATLRQELYGSSVSCCERYAEVDASAIKIVTKEDIDAVCTSQESGMEQTLKPYQLVGVNFLLLLYRKRIGGAILADEMGLGKTVQAVTYLNLLKHLDDDPGPHLIVCPASLLENWERELRRWCPSFSVVLFHGASRTAYSRELSSMGKAGLPPPFNVLVTCYSLFERHTGQQKDNRKVLRYWQWSCVLMDEAHALKDKSSSRWRSLMSIAKHARQRLMLTGTPLQNDLHELWSLLEFMLPDIFANEDADFKKQLNADDNELISQIKSILGPFVLRRLKSDVMQQLSAKIQQVEYVHMEVEQAEAYREAISDYRAFSQARTAKSLNAASKNKFSSLPKRQISNYFMQFRKIANHPLLVRRIYKDVDVVHFAEMLYSKGAFGFECNLERAILELQGYNDFQIHQLLSSYYGAGSKGTLTDAHVLSSAKCQALVKLLPSLKMGGHRVLIFSQWTSMLDILEWTLDVIGVKYSRLDGSTPVTERQRIVDTFNNDSSFFACLLSTRAGGQGLNLIGADSVIIHDMDFNPQIDRQAEDRCHRIGQTKPVTVYRLVTKETVDENIYEIARRKLVLDAAVLESGTHPDNETDIPEKTMGEILSALLLS